MSLLNFNVEILTIITLLLTAINGMVHSKNLAQYIVIFTFVAAFAAIEKLFYNQKTRNWVFWVHPNHTYIVVDFIVTQTYD